MNPIWLLDPLRVGDLEDSFFFKLKFSGVASSGAESTSKSDSGELGGPVLDGDNDRGIENDLALIRGLLGEDSDSVSCSVSVDILGRFVATVMGMRKVIKTRCHSHFEAIFYIPFYYV